MRLLHENGQINPRHALLVSLVIVAGCVSAGERVLSGSRAEGFEPGLTRTRAFSLTTAYRPAISAASELPLRVYIEGDGRAWLTRTRVSDDPSPRNPVALEMARRDRSGAAVLYVARPCQFEGREDPACEAAVWTGGRFSAAVVDSIADAIEQFKGIAGADAVIVIGYSGGGDVAALVAAQRADTALLVTVAAPLDHRLWTRHHGVSPLSRSLQPVDHLAALSRVPQLHFAGGRDTVVPRAMIDSFTVRLAAGADVRTVVLEGYDHVCCWVDGWEELQTSIAHRSL